MEESKTRVSTIRLQASRRSRDSSSLSSSSVSVSNASENSNAITPTTSAPYTLTTKLKSSPSLPHIKTDIRSREKLHGGVKEDSSDHDDDVSDDESYTSATESSEGGEEEYDSESYSSGSSSSYAGSSDEFEPPRNKDVAFKSGQVVTALYDYTGSTDAELNFRRGDQFIIVDSNDTNWLYCSLLRDPSTVGYVPSNYVNLNGSEHKRNTIGKAPLHSPSIYDNEALNAKLHICGNSTKLSNAEEVADAFAHVPRGCKASTLFRMSLEGGHETSKRMAPRLNADGIGFKDLLVDDKKPKIRRSPVHCTIAFSLLEARHVPVPLPNPGCHITGRHVRISVFDKTSVRSNVLVVPAIYNEDVWKFSAKASLLFPRDDENTCIVRTNEKDFNLCVLFEFCVAFAVENGGKKDVATTDVATGELGCGWAILPLYTAEGNAIEIRTYEIKLNGGTPFERDIILGDEVAKKGLWETLTNATRTPKLNIRLWNLGKSAMNTINTLPEVLISFLSHVPVLAYYRQIQADALLIGKDEEPDLQLKFHPALAAMQVLIDQPDLMRILVRAWEFEVRRARRKEKRSAKIMKQKFCKTVISIWPLCNILEMPNHVAGDNAIETLRGHFTTRYRAEGPVAILASYPCTASHTPFSVQELSARPRLVHVT